MTTNKNIINYKVVEHVNSCNFSVDYVNISGRSWCSKHRFDLEQISDCTYRLLADLAN